MVLFILQLEKSSSAGFSKMVNNLRNSVFTEGSVVPHSEAIPGLCFGYTCEE